MKHVEYRELSDLSNVQIMELLFKKIALFSCLVRRAPILFSTFQSWIEENKMDFNQIAITMLKLRQELSACLSLVESGFLLHLTFDECFDCNALPFSVSENGDRKGTNLRCNRFLILK